MVVQALLFALMISTPATVSAQASDAGVLSMADISSNLNSESVRSHSSHVSLEFVDVPLVEALNDIARVGGLQLIYGSDVLPAEESVTITFDDVDAKEAVRRTLAGQPVQMYSQGNLVVFAAAPLPRAIGEPEVGSIVGRVTDSSTGVGIDGVSVLVQGTDLGALTGNTGRYGISDVPAGTHTLVVKRLGYAEIQRTVTVPEGGIVAENFELEVTAMPMDEIVVTGTGFETEVRAVPNPVSVMTAEEIEAKAVTNVTDLLRGEVPGVMALSYGPEGLASAIFARGNAGGGGIGAGRPDVVKIYVDGVEVASPVYLSTIDPRSVERVEVIRGPQASALYGSEASSGVIQLFTKKGTPGRAQPRITLQAALGVEESDYTPSGAGTPMRQEYSFDVDGGGESFSYHAGSNYQTEGEWVYGYGSEALNASAGLRASQGPLSLDLTARWSDREFDWGNRPIFYDLPSDACPQCGNPDFLENEQSEMNQTTFALKVGYRATPEWQHTLTVGDEQNFYGVHQPEPSFNTPADTFMWFHRVERHRRTIRYETTYNTDLGQNVTGRFISGLDHGTLDLWISRATNLPISATGGWLQLGPTTSPGLNNDSWWNTGYFGMAEVGIQDQLFLTMGGRVEEHSLMGEDYGRAFNPRVGASYVRDLGAVDLKVRAEWGEGLRAPPPTARAGEDTYGSILLPNPDIAPSEKSGWDAGFDVVWGNRASLSLTRYDEEATGLIQRVPIDLSGELPVYQFQNTGVVGLKGWEVEGTLTMGRVTLSGNYAYSDNEVLKVSEETAANPDATFQVGDRTQSVPEHSGGVQARAWVGRGTVSLDGSFLSGWRAIDYIDLYGYQYGGDDFRGSIRDYYEIFPALWKWNLRAEQALFESVSGFLKVDNLFNNLSPDVFNFRVARGRTTMLGVRWTL